MRLQVIKYNRLHAMSDHVLAVYYVCRSLNGTALQLTKLKEEDDGDSDLAIKQIAARSGEDAKECDHATMG